MRSTTEVLANDYLYYRDSEQADLCVIFSYVVKEGAVARIPRLSIGHTQHNFTS